MKPNASAISTTLLRCANTVRAIVIAAAAGLAATALAGQSGTVDVDLAGVQHIDNLGSPNNTIVQVSVPAGAVLQGVGWAGTLTTIGESWAEDADFAISDGSQLARIFTPAEGHGPTPPGGTFYTSGGVVSFGSMGLPGYPVPGGVVFIEFVDSVMDDPGAAEAFWGNNSTLTIAYEIGPVGPCAEDLSGDGVVDVSDLLELLSGWGACPTGSSCPADFNDDSSVDVSDLLVLLGAWGDCPPAGELESACCFDDGTCQNLTQNECGKLGGNYQGDYTTCASWACQQPPDGTSCEFAIPLEIDGAARGGDTTGTTPPTNMPLCQSAGVPPLSTGILWYTVEGDGSLLTARSCESELGSTTMAVYCAQSCDPNHFSCVAGSNESECDNPFIATVSWCSAPGREYLIAVWSTSGTYGEVAVSVESGAPCSDPMQCELQCDGLCNSPSPTGCWCGDDPLLCQIFGDCCPGVCQSCPDLPSCACMGVTCPPGATPETETCGTSSNGGCEANPNTPPMQAISCGETVCGTTWGDDSLRDTDWYSLDLTGNAQAQYVTVSVNSDIPVFVHLVEAGCPATIIDSRNGCNVSFSTCLVPGEYSVVISPASFFGYPCSQGPFRYTATIQCAANCPSSCAGWCGQESPSGCFCDDECWLFEDCCPDVCVACPGTDGC